MAKFIVLLAAIASVHGAVNRVGWSTPAPTTVPPPPPTTTTPAPPPPTTPGWSPPPPPPPTTTPGWSPPPPPPPPPSGWGPAPVNNVSVALSGEVAAAGAGTAGESHAENIHVTGGWGVPADLLMASGGEAVVAQEGSITQLAAIDGESVTGLNSETVSSIAAADESLAVIATGLDIAVDQSGWAGASGASESAALGNTVILVNA